MLGIRLDAETEAGLARMARHSGRTKSEIARDAIKAFISERTRDDALDRELAAIAAATREEDLATLDAVHDDVLELIDTEERHGIQDKAV